jgi:hypothetical protein
MAENERHEWRSLRDIFYALNSHSQPLRAAFPLPGDLESATVNAIRSRKVRVRGRRCGGYSGLTPEGAFELIDQYLGPKAEIDVLLNRVIVPGARPPGVYWTSKT